MVFLLALHVTGCVPTEDVSDTASIPAEAVSDAAPIPADNTVAIRVTDLHESHPWLFERATNLRQVAPSKASGSERSLRTLDDVFVELCERLPGFGGLFYDDTGRLNVYLLDPTQETEARAAMQIVLGDQLVRRANRMQRGTPEAAIDAVDQIDITFLQGEFTFAQLKTWKDRISTLPEPPKNIVYLDADEKANRVTIGVGPGSRVDMIEDLLVKHDIPRRAVVIGERGVFAH
jgi:hypothetical protein